MSSEKPKFLLYQLNPLKRLEEIKLKDQGKKEKYIENLFSENLETIFPELIALKQQCYLKHPVEEKNCIIDSLAFNKTDNSFLIIEYKTEKAPELVYQVEEYMECLADENDKICFRNRHKLLRLLDNDEFLRKGRKNKDWEEEEIDWDKTKALCIITDIHGYQKTLFRKESEKIKLVKITFYGESILYIDIEKIVDWLKISSRIKLHLSPGSLLEPESGSISDITKMEWPSAKVKDWLIKLDNFLSSIKNLTKEINNKNINYYPVISYMVAKKILFSSVVKAKQINIYWNFKNPSVISQNLSSLLNKYSIEHSEKNHRGTGKWNFPIIDNDNSFQKLKEFIQDYKNYCGNNLKID